MRWVVGILLVGAALLKGAQLYLEPAVVLTSAAGRVLIPAQIAAELVLGTFALFGLYWRTLRWFALVLFSSFAIYSFHLATSGATSCGCFGPLQVHPWWTFGLDVAIVLGLLVSIRSEVRVPSLRVSQPKLATTLTLLSLSLAAAIGLYAAPRQSPGNSLAMVGGLTLLEPEEWVGKPLPVADFIDLDLSTGEWIVVLHRHDCPKCLESVPRYEQLATDQKVALVEVPPFGAHAMSDGFCEVARLREVREWFVQTPVEIRLRDGVVVSASIDLPALASAMEP